MSDTKKTESSDKLLVRLRRALEERELVRVRRDIRRAEKLCGYVVGLGERWVLLAALDSGIAIDGYQALRLADIKSVKRDKEGESFARRALDLEGQWPPRAPANVALDDDPSLIASAARTFPLLALHVERGDPDVCHIGVPQDWNKRSLGLLEVDTNAEWEERPGKFKLADLTRVDFGGRYERVLWKLAGPPPATAPQPAEPSGSPQLI